VPIAFFILSSMNMDLTTSIEIVSHRGARFEAPENTVAGFLHAVRLGMTTVELDVHLTRDSQLAVIHDPTVDRTTNGTGAVRDFTMEELRALDARAEHDHWPEPVSVPSLEETLLALTGMPSIEVEIKKDTPERLETVVRLVLETMASVGRSEGIVLTSFDPGALELAMRFAPEQPRGHMGDWTQEETWANAAQFRVSKVGINLGHATPDIVARAQAAGYCTVAWPCNDNVGVEKTKYCGFDQVCTDNPSVIAPMFGREVREMVAMAR
jgi:glycerophosphoryl diester phosphodiesterase